MDPGSLWKFFNVDPGTKSLSSLVLGDHFLKLFINSCNFDHSLSLVPLLECHSCECQWSELFLLLLRTVKVTQVVQGFNGKEVVKIVAHPEAKHVLAVTVDGCIFSWGAGDSGQLGHGDNKWVCTTTENWMLSLLIYILCPTSTAEILVLEISAVGLVVVVNNILRIADFGWQI